jgi:hypothetical protein
MTGLPNLMLGAAIVVCVFGSCMAWLSKVVELFDRPLFAMLLVTLVDIWDSGVGVDGLLQNDMCRLHR